MLTNGETVDLAEWIIDDPFLFGSYSWPGYHFALLWDFEDLCYPTSSHVHVIENILLFKKYPFSYRYEILC